MASASYDAANELTQWGPAAIAYDADGNITDDGTNTYTWNARNELTSIAGPANATFQYDAFGRRVSKTVGGATTGFLYDGANPVEELSSGSVSATILGGLATDEFFAWTHASGESSFITDLQGSTLALTDGSGNNVAQYSYDPFGGVNVTGSSTNANQYTGRENDGTGVDYYRARYYSPALNRFLSEDPQDFAGGGLNLYSYVNDGTVDFTDKTGQSFLNGCLFTAFGYAASVIAGRKSAFDPLPSELSACGSLSDWDRFEHNLTPTVIALVVVAPQVMFQGGHCGIDGSLFITCTGASWGYARAGTTYGNVFITGQRDPNPELLQHERRHSSQWSLLGPSFPVLYLGNEALSQALSGSSCFNVFEWDAGFQAGGYAQECNGFGQKR